MESQNITSTLKTVRDYVRYAGSVMLKEEVFFGHGTDNAWDEAVQLVLHALHFPPDLDDRILDAKLIMEERELVIHMIHQRAVERIPLPYITKIAYFGGLSFAITKDVIIPRSPIAEIINEGFHPWIQEDKIDTVLDLCTGSGCIGILMALSYIKANVDLVDISSDAIAIAKKNVAEYNLQERVNVIESDLFSKLRDKKYQIIISNPPYVAEDNLQQLPKEYSYEPPLALSAGVEGIDIAEKILNQAANYLTRDGFLVMEVGEAKDALIARFPKAPFTWLDFEQGGEGVLIFEQAQLKRFANNT